MDDNPIISSFKMMSTTFLEKESVDSESRIS